MSTLMKPWHLTWNTTEVQGRPASYGEAGEGTPFIFLHGWGLRDHTYRRAMSRLARLGLRVLAPSLPGFGGTPPLPSASYDLAGYAQWVTDFAAAAGVEGRFYLGGHSFGGGVAIQTAHDFGVDCELLVLVNSIGGGAWKQQLGATSKRSLSERPIWDWGVHFPLDIAHRGTSSVAMVVLQDGLRNVLRDPIGFWRVGAIARHANLLPELDDLKARGLPVAILWGNEDTIMPSASLDAIVGAVGHDAHIVPGSHNWLLADPDRFGEVMTNIVQVAEQAHVTEPVELLSLAP